ncbi:MAG: hypothetical protein ACOVQA_07315 [Thermoflexibacteraceae bacterium]
MKIYFTFSVYSHALRQTVFQLCLDNLGWVLVFLVSDFLVFLT